MIFVLIRPPVSFESINGSCKHYYVSIFQQKFDPHENYHQMSYFKAKIHQIRLPQILLGAYSAPQTP